MKLSKSLLIAAALTLMMVIVVQAAGPTGAIFTTTPDGTIVNENVRYTQKIEVYLDGGPGPNAPQTAAGLDDGLYVFQVTDPSGKFLLSQDPSMCRVVEVKDGVIYREVPATELGFASDTYTVGSKTYPCHIQDGPEGAAGKSGQHDTNIDADHGLPAIVVQLMPFGDTPNPGGVYKAWMEKLQSYIDKLGDLSLVPVAIKGIGAKECPNFCANRDPGFGPANTDTKTDNFKVKKTKFISPEITVKKFHDKNANGVFDTGDEWVTGWQVDVTDPAAVTNAVWTPATIVAEPYGLWSFLEETPAGTLQTASYVDGLATSPLFPTNPATVTVVGTSGETHEVVFGDVGLGTATACKVYDRNGNGTPDAGEPPVIGWKMELTGTVANGTVIGPIDKFTGSDGCVTYDGLLPGDYIITELFPSGNWIGSGPSSYDFTIVSTLTGSEMSGGSFTFTFTNYCVCTVGFNTKGYWHNKNGLTELTTADRDYVNGLDPYDAPSGYFGAGDEPFDGLFENGDPVEAAFNNDDGSLIWGEGTWQAEVSLFLVDPNAGGGGGDQEQLAQQLLAFIFNVRHRLGSPNVVIQVNGEWVSAQSIIDSAIAAWASPTTDDDKYWEPILDGLNNNGAVPLIKYSPCAVVY